MRDLLNDGEKRMRRWGLVVPGIALSVALPWASQARGETVAFGYTGTKQTFTVPYGILEVDIVAVGGRGGGELGGHGAVARATTPVFPGQVLEVFVGGNGTVTEAPQFGPPAYNGGGRSGGDGAGGGGGSTEVLGFSPPNVGGFYDPGTIVNAAGGGGTGGLGGGYGGDAGQPGETGVEIAPPCDELARGGAAGSFYEYYGSGGDGATSGPFVGHAGDSGVGYQGGRGGPSTIGGDPVGGGGGGGGGIFGGGGGAAGLHVVYLGTPVSGSCAAGGGGGGASYFAPYATNTSLATDTTGVPSVTISYGESADRVPQTKIDKSPKAKTTKRSPRFKFSSSEPGSTFMCKLDRRGRQECESPVRYTHVREGKHRFQVRATNAFGTPDPTPARFEFEVVEAKR